MIPVNITTPVDLFGSMITERLDGETVREYRERVLQVASAMALRDLSDGEWRLRREQELTGHTGVPVRLHEGAQDRRLRKAAVAQLLTWQRLETWEGPFRWPELGAAGLPYHYNEVTGLGSGVGSALDMAPYYDETQHRYLTGAGYVMAAGDIWYVTTGLERVVHQLPPNTTSTVLLPYQITSTHGHAIEVVDRRTLRFVADDHEHLVTFADNGTWAFDNSADHEHELTPITARGPVFLRCGDAVVRRSEDIDGSFAIPVPQLRLIPVRTLDGAHETLVDPYEYYRMRFTIGDAAHQHEVRRLNPTDAFLTALAPEQGSAHTHRIALPTVPANRFLTPLLTTFEGESIDGRLADDPFVAYLAIEEGWTVVSNPSGFGEVLVAAFDTQPLTPVPVETNREKYVLGLGPALEAAHVAIVSALGGLAGETLRLRIRTEDQYSGGVPNQTCTARLILGGVELVRTLTTDSDAEAELSFQLPTATAALGVLRFEIDATVTDEHDVYVFEHSGMVIAGYGATPWGLDYGA